MFKYEYSWKTRWRFDKNLTFTFNVIFLELDEKKIKKNIGDTHHQNRFLYRSLSRKPHFSAYFQFPGFPLFQNPILSLELDSTRNSTQGIVSWNFFSIFMLIWIKFGTDLWKWCNIFYRRFLRSSSIIFQSLI